MAPAGRGLFSGRRPAAILGGGAIFFMKTGRSSGRVEELLKTHHDDIVNLQQDLKNLQPVLTTIAVQKEQIAPAPANVFCANKPRTNSVKAVKNKLIGFRFMTPPTIIVINFYTNIS